MPVKDPAGRQRPCWEALQRLGQTWHQEGSPLHPREGSATEAAPAMGPTPPSGETKNPEGCL